MEFEEFDFDNEIDGVRGVVLVVEVDVVVVEPESLIEDGGEATTEAGLICGRYGKKALLRLPTPPTPTPSKFNCNGFGFGLGFVGFRLHFDVEDGDPLWRLSSVSEFGGEIEDIFCLNDQF